MNNSKWKNIIARRAKLIYKKNRGGLNEEEERELSNLQGEVADVINRNFRKHQSRVSKIMTKFDKEWYKDKYEKN